MTERVIVIGLDGATWDLIDPMVREGKLPCIARLVEEGKRADLISCIPPTTFPAWKCYSTGMGPGKLGVFGMFRPDFQRRRIEIPSSLSFGRPELWDTLGDMGFRVCVLNMPTTYPVKEVNGAMVGGPFSSSSGYTYPPDIERRLLHRIGYRPFMEELIISEDKASLVGAAKEIISTRFEAAKLLREEFDPDFIHLTVFHIDTLQHFLWGTPELEGVWTHIDGLIQDLLSHLGEGWSVVLVSDHGFGKTRYKFYVNNWLIREGLLAVRGGKGRALGRIGVDRGRVYRGLKRVGLISLAKRLLPTSTLRRLARSLPSEDGTMEVEGLEGSIVWEKTVAINNNECVFIDPPDEDRRREIVERVRTGLLGVESPSGERAVRRVLSREEAFWGPHVDIAPDLVIIPSEGFEPKSTILMSGELFTDESASGKAHHRMEGIFLAWGPIAGPLERVERMSIMDVAPTILRFMGVEARPDMDGRSRIVDGRGDGGTPASDELGRLDLAIKEFVDSGRGSGPEGEG